MSMLIEGIENELDPVLDSVLEKALIKKGSSHQLKLGDLFVDFDKQFALFMTSRLANPHFSPELSAKCTVIDFTVTMIGLE